MGYALASTEQSVIEDAVVPDTGCVFFLGCFEKRVTFYSQQVRALNLVHALLSEDVVRSKNGRVAVIGGGLAGVTVAAAFARAAPEIKVVIYESRDSLLGLQRGARARFVHPHIFDWPVRADEGDEAGLPLLNWRAGFATDIVAQLDKEFESIVRHSRIDVRTGQKVTDIEVTAGIAAKVTTTGGVSSELYDAVIVCVGFGLEREVTPQANPSYWSPSILPAPFLSEQSAYSIFVSGNGDGGLADFALAAFGAKDHQQILSLVTGYPGLEQLRAELLTIDNEAWKTEDFDIHAAYISRLTPLVPKHLLRDVFDLLRPSVKIILHTRENNLLRRDTAVLSRFLVFLIIAADSKFNRNSIETVTGVNFSLATDGTGAVLLPGRPLFVPQIRMLRFGPDAQTNMQPFDDLAQRYQRVHASRLSRRPTTPMLLPKVTERWPSPDVPPAVASDNGGVGAGGGGANAAPVADVREAAHSNQINVVHGAVGTGATVTQTYHVGNSKAGR